MTDFIVDQRGQQSVVRFQGNRHTCSSFAVSAAHEWLINPGDSRSVEFAHWLAKQRDGLAGEATWPRFVLEGLEAVGQPPENAWPYGSPLWGAGPPAGAVDHADLRRIGGWRPLSAQFDDVLNELQAGVPVVLTLRVVRTAWAAAADDGRITADAGRPAPASHAVLAVGVTAAQDSDRRSLLVKNSWGIGWGEQGYGYVTEDYWTTYGVQAVAMEPR